MIILQIVALFCYLGCIGAAVISPSTEKARGQVSLAGKVLTWAGLLLHLAAFIGAWIHSSNFPVIGFKAVCSFIALAIIIYHVVFTQRYKSRLLTIFLMTAASLLLMVSLHLPAPENPIPASLAEAFQNDLVTRVLLPIHVMLLLFSYAAFLVTVGCGVMYLLQERLLKARKFGKMFQWLPALNTCDEVSYVSITFGFVGLSLGMITGMYWGNRHDGRFWHNDPKEVLTLVTWVCYLAMVHYRITAGWRGRRVAWLSIGGFLAVLVTFVGARAMGGYHIFG